MNLNELTGKIYRNFRLSKFTQFYQILSKTIIYYVKYFLIHSGVNQKIKLLTLTLIAAARIRMRLKRSDAMVLDLPTTNTWVCFSVSFLLNVFYVFSLVLDVRYRMDKFVKTFFPFFHLTYLNSIKVITKFFSLFLERLQKLINYLRELYLHIINVC